MRSMNGAAENRGYPGGSGGSSSGGGNGLGGGVHGMMVGPNPELKHHADFLTRLLAATPNYMSEIGNPPPGFFSDWLRRLVSKPSGNSASPTAPAIQTSPLTFSGQPETNGAALDAHIIPTKRRKRSRLNEQPPQHAAKTESEMDRERDRERERERERDRDRIGSGGNGNGGHSSSAAAAQAAMLSNPFAAHPLWFFPPFLPNPYMSGMNMTGLPSLTGPSAPSGYLGHGSSAASELFRTENLLGSGHPTVSHPFNPATIPSPLDSGSERDRLINNLRNNSTSPPSSINKNSSTSIPTFAHHHHHGLGQGGGEHLYHLGANTTPPSGEKESSGRKSGGGRVSSKVSGSCARKKSSSSSFSISRLTSPSPSSNSSGGSGVGSGNAMGGCGRLLQHHLETSSPNALLPGAVPRVGDEKLFHPGLSNSASGIGGTTKDMGKVRAPTKSPCSKLNVEDAGLCVDLRVSGRIWDSTAPRPIYKPLSAFREPTDVNLYNSSGPSPRSSSSSSAPTTNTAPTTTTTLPSTTLAPTTISTSCSSSTSSFTHHSTSSITTPTIYSSQLESLDYSQPAGGGGDTKQHKMGQLTTSHGNLSTRYILRNLQQIYQRMRPPYPPNHHHHQAKHLFNASTLYPDNHKNHSNKKFNTTANNNHSTGDNNYSNHRSDSQDSDNESYHRSTLSPPSTSVISSRSNSLNGRTVTTASSSLNTTTRSSISNISSLIAPRPVNKNDSSPPPPLGSVKEEKENYSKSTSSSPPSSISEMNDKSSVGEHEQHGESKISSNINNNNTISNNNNNNNHHKHSSNESVIKKSHSDEEEEEEDEHDVGDIDEEEERDPLLLDDEDEVNIVSDNETEEND